MFFPYGLGGLGLVFYLTRFPECCLPEGRVDLYGASHQIWHMLIFAGLTKKSFHNLAYFDDFLKKRNPIRE